MVSDMYNFNGQVVFISGGGTGIGYAVARGFLHHGARVILAGRRLDILHDATARLSKQLSLPSEAVTCKSVDVGDTNDMKKLVGDIQSEFGRLDVVINNCGTWEKCALEEMTDEFMNKHINNNLKTVINGTAMARKLLSSGGAVINMGSFSGVLPMQQASLYSCLKSSVVSFTQSSASELAEHGIRVNCVIPGVIRTPMTASYIDEHYEKLIEPIPLGRVGQPEDVANGVLFLCSDQASYITGTSLTISGGKFITQ